MVITGSAAEVRFVAVPPPAGGRRVVVRQLPGESGTPEAMAALPLPGVQARLVYPALPPRRVGPDVLLDRYAPVADSAVVNPAATARLVEVPGLAHVLVTRQDVVDAEVTAWPA